MYRKREGGIQCEINTRKRDNQLNSKRCKEKKDYNSKRYDKIRRRKVRTEK